MTGDALTLGVEEEFLLVDAEGRLSELGPDIVGSESWPESGLQRELVRCQVETATPVCDGIEELLAQVRKLRRQLTDRAVARELRLMPSGTPVLPEPGPPPITPNPRYHRIAREFGAITDTAGTCSCHVHVGVPDRAAGVAVSNRLRAWLPVLLALTANSPFDGGHDTGYCSWRHVRWARWPSSGPPPVFSSVDHYDTVVQALLRAGAVLDRGMVYWDIRLSEKQPTLEVRVCDVPGTADEAALLAAIVRGLVATALQDTGRAPRPTPDVLRAALWRAARDGLDGHGFDPLTATLRPMREQLARLTAYVRPALRDAGDLDFVTARLARLTTTGDGASRQRAAYAERRALRDVVDMLARQTNC
ncbi:carboxylate-amine ligase [Amycolatopsis cihanbeyliensis]|uniref:Putative glutamate--cysteine ligase 2 n=1 Tax=Amycolatopsis cihanbeyliensis TaxID=1128664 RepID=A0A542DCV3_AMYCI|nr:glutamate--cysteine ligase [Amycolatopsis cihanbeyliensis]TQJ00885.1 carboxylate-amine ligase [Amycolatopsis cihanbeyliensis]